MFCKYCGNQLPEIANFCPKCGKINDTAGKEENNSSGFSGFYEPYDFMEVEKETAVQREKDELGGKILKFAILGLAFGCTVWLSLLGLIFSIVARVKVREYIVKFGQTEGRATVGKSLSIAGLIVSIVFTALCLLWIFLMILILLLTI